MEAIILAGGFGTRLQSIVSDVPKPMAPINEKPFLTYLLDFLAKYDVNHVVLSTGYKHEIIESYFLKQYKDITISYSRETNPLGTGGAIKKAMELIDSEKVLVLNGDTFFNVNLHKLWDFHVSSKGEISLALKYLRQFDRYGAVVLEDYKVIGFENKMYKEEGYINGGIYVLNKHLFDSVELPSTFSFESIILEEKRDQFKINGFKADDYFIDIGIPEDYRRAQYEIKELF